jgi:hypothetical protein
MGPSGGLHLQIRYEKIFEKNLCTTLKMQGGDLSDPGVCLSGPKIYMVIDSAGEGRGERLAHGERRGPAGGHGRDWPNETNLSPRAVDAGGKPAPSAR